MLVLPQFVSIPRNVGLSKAGKVQEVTFRSFTLQLPSISRRPLRCKAALFGRKDAPNLPPVNTNRSQITPCNLRIHMCMRSRTRVYVDMYVHTRMGTCVYTNVFTGRYSCLCNYTFEYAFCVYIYTCKHTCVDIRV